MTACKVEDGKILIIDDEPGNVKVFERVLKGAGFKNIFSITDSLKAEETYKKIQPDLILLDLKMPELDGFGVMEMLKKVERETYLPILVLTAQRDPSTRIRALESGAKDFLSKPFEMTEAVTRVKNMLEVRLLHNEVREHNKILEQKVRERTQELEELQLDLIHRLSRAAEYRDQLPGRHVIRMSHFCSRLAQEMGLDREQCELIHLASPLHDIGKIGIPDHILIKSEPLSPQEREIMKLHPIIGAEILSGSKSSLLQMAESICRSYHETWEGSGYPSGLQGEEIPLVGRITAICNEFDKLTQVHCDDGSRVSLEEAMHAIEKRSGTEFDPALVKALKRILPEMEEIVGQFPDQSHLETLNRYRPVKN